MERELSKSEYKIWFDAISMEFPGVLALDDVSVGVRPGTIHVLMGEDGEPEPEPPSLVPEDLDWL